MPHVQDVQFMIRHGYLRGELMAMRISAFFFELSTLVETVKAENAAEARAFKQSR